MKVQFVDEYQKNVDIDSYDPLEIAFQELKEEKIAFEIKKEEEK